MDKQIRERFWTRVYKGDGCWLFRGSEDKDGYMRIQIKRQQVRAHRLSWEINFGEIPFGMCVLHRCDNPPCVRPDHLFLGTILDNNRDRSAKGRTSKTYQYKGEENGRAKVTEEDVLSMRSIYSSGEMTQVALAKQFGITYWQVYRIINNLSWKHTLLMPRRS